MIKNSIKMKTTIFPKLKNSKVNDQTNKTKNKNKFVVNTIAPKFDFKNKKGEIIRYN